jgi:hypothetical protein
MLYIFHIHFIYSTCPTQINMGWITLLLQLLLLLCYWYYHCCYNHYWYYYYITGTTTTTAAATTTTTGATVILLVLLLLLPPPLLIIYAALDFVIFSVLFIYFRSKVWSGHFVVKHNCSHRGRVYCKDEGVLCRTINLLL